MSTEPVSCVTSWRSRVPAEISWFDIPPDFVAFHRPSGKTHFLNESSKVLLTDILIEPKDLTAILAAFSTEVADETADRYVEQMKAMLTHLEDLGLIEQA